MGLSYGRLYNGKIAGRICQNHNRSPFDFTTDWTNLFAGIGFDAITSSMALHHAENKQLLFQRIFLTLKPKGLFVFADHMAGASPCIEHLLVRERALVRLGRDGLASHFRGAETDRLKDAPKPESGLKNHGGRHAHPEYARALV